MANLKQRSGKHKKVHADRCVNPFGGEGHVGKGLRKVSKNLLKMFSHVPANSKICSKCRDLCTSEIRCQDTSDNDISQDLNESTEDSTEDVDVSPSKKPCLSREEELEELLEGVKQKFLSLPDNDPLRVSILTIAPDCWSIRKTAEEFGASYHMAKKAKDLRNSDGVLASSAVKKGKKLPDETVSKVIGFYESDMNSRIMPHKKETVVVYDDDVKKRMQKRLLLCDIQDLHTQFQEEFKEYPIGLTKFAELRPKWCVTAGKAGTHSVCVCVKHENFKTMFDAAKLQTLSEISKVILNDYKDCIDYVLCENKTVACQLLECGKCPDIEKFSDLVVRLLRKSNIQQVIFSTWTATDGCTLKQECLNSEDFADTLSEYLQELIPHDFISKAQSNFVSKRKDSLKADEVLLQCDFAENYAYVAQNAAQAFHYNNDQCTVFTIVFYYRCGVQTKHCSIILLSDCTAHDTASVYLMQQIVIPEIIKVCPKVKKIIYVTDGAKQHFKNRYNMCNLMNHETNFNIKAEWHFHATAHGKGPCDGLGAILKREAGRYSLQVDPNKAILNSTSLFNWAKAKFSNIQIFHYSKGDHDRTQKLLNRKYTKVQAVPGIQKNHAFIPISANKLQIKRYSNAENSVKLQY